MSDKDYYERRLADERRSAQSAKKPEAVAAHHELAELYATRVRALNGTGDALTS